MSKTVDIFIKSYYRDFWLLKLALQTISKNVSGYKNVVLLIPENEKALFDTREMPERTSIHYVPEYGNGYLLQQTYKLSAHNYCFSDFIMYSDSDVFFHKPIDLQDLIKGNKPEILYTHYDQLPDAQIWKTPTSMLMGEDVEYEFMRRLPLTYHRSTLEHINTWSPGLEKTIMDAHLFSEFNFLGAYAFKFEKEKYHFQNTDGWIYVEPIAKQVWSHASKQPGSDELHLREFIRTLETLLNCFGIVVPV